MKKIDVIYEILLVDKIYVNLMDQFDHTKLEIYEIFVIDYRQALDVFIEGMFYDEDAGDVFSENVSMSDHVPNEVRDNILRFDPTLEEEITKEELVEVCLELFKVEVEIRDTYNQLVSKGVNFIFIKENPLNAELLNNFLSNDFEGILSKYNTADYNLQDVKSNFEALINPNTILQMKQLFEIKNSKIIGNLNNLIEKEESRFH
jgi:hypothetical protein